jgi:hypothetical protein
VALSSVACEAKGALEEQAFGSVPEVNVARRASNRYGCAVLLLVLFVPATLTAYVTHSAIWLIVVPLGIIAFVGALAAVLGNIKRKLTPEQFADKLERHLDLWAEDRENDDTIPFAIADERLERLAWEIQALDLRVESNKDKLRAIIATLRRGEVPDALLPTQLTYRNRCR